MGTKYTSQSVTGYNSSPPADDGSQVGSNQVKWNTVKTKVGDPLNNFASAINTALVTALDMSMSTSAVTYTTTAADHLKPVRITAAATVHLGDAATMAVGYQTAVVNAYSAAITVDLATAGNKLNTVVGGSISLQPGNAIIVAVNQAGDGYDILAHSFFDDTTPAPKIAGATVNYNAEVSLASAATVNIGAAASNNILITGTTTITAFDTVAAGITRTVRFSGVLTVTNNNTSLILPYGASITTRANDCMEFESLGSGNWICRSSNRPSQILLFDSGAISASAGVAVTSVIDNTKFLEYVIRFYNMVPAAATQLGLQVSSTNGSPYDGAARYLQSYHDSSTAGTGSDGGTEAGTFMGFGGATNVTNAAPGLSGIVHLFVPTGAGTGMQAIYDVTYTDATHSHRVTGMDDYNFAAAVNAFNVFFSGQNITSGRFTVWGVPL